MKKFISLVFALVIIFAIVGCGNGNGDDEQTQYETEAVAEDVQEFIIEFAVLMDTQLAWIGNMWFEWGVLYLRSPVRMHHVPPYWYDELYMNEFIHRVAAEKVRGFTGESDIENYFAALVRSFGSINQWIRFVAEVETGDDFSVVTFLEESAEHQLFIYHNNMFRMQYDRLGELLPSKRIFESRVDTMFWAGLYDEFRNEVLARHNFNFDFDHGFVIPPRYIIRDDDGAVSFDMPFDYMAWLEDMTNLMIIQIYAWQASLIATHNPNTGMLVIATHRGSPWNYYMANLHFTYNLRDSFNATIIAGIEEFHTLELSALSPILDLIIEIFYLDDLTIDLVTGSINLSTFQSIMIDTIYAINEIMSEYALLIPELNLLRIDDELISNYRVMRDEILERLDLPFDLNSEWILSDEESLELSEQFVETMRTLTERE